MRKNEIFKSKKIVLLIAVAIMNVLGCGVVSAQCPCAVPIPNEERLPAGFYPKGSPEYIALSGEQNTSTSLKPSFRSSDATVNIIGIVSFLRSKRSFTDYLPDFNGPYRGLYNGNFLTFVDPPSITPYQVKIWIGNFPLQESIDTFPEGESINVVYSLYTYKSTVSQGGTRRPMADGTFSMQAIQECGFGVDPILTQADIDKNLDKIYEFPTVYNETAIGVRLIDWDGKASNGMPVRDCVFVAAHDKDTGNLLGVRLTGLALEGYYIQASPGVEYTAGPTSVSAKITLAYDRPVRRIWAILAESNCTTGSAYVTFGVVNRGGEAIAAGMNQLGGPYAHSALAVTELKNPVLDEDGLVKIFSWDNITGLDGKPVVPPDNNTDYLMIIDIEGDDGYGNVIPTFTGLNDGYLYADNSNMHHFPMPWNYTGIQNPVRDKKIVIETTPAGFVINSKGNYGGDWALTSAAGAKVSSGKGSFVSKSGLPKGVYLLTVSSTQGGRETQKVIVR